MEINGADNQRCINKVLQMLLGDESLKARPHLYTNKAVFPLVRIFFWNPFSYRFLYRFFQKYGFLDFCTDWFFWRDHFYRFYSLILLFCKLCECDTICCELCDDKYPKNLVSILSILLLQSIDTFSCFFM